MVSIRGESSPKIMKNDLIRILKTVLKQIGEENGIDFSNKKVSIQENKEKSHGDYASNLAMVIAKDLSQTPREVAEKISKSGTQPLLGSQINFLIDGLIAKIPIFATSNIGYKNLTKLSSKSYLSSDGTTEPHCSIGDLENLNEGLIVLSGNHLDLFGKLLDWKNIDDLIPQNFKNGKKIKKTGKAGIFAGSLELVKEGNIKIKQEKLFDDIYIRESND